MQTKLIQTKDYLLLINEEAEIKINESTYDFEICPCFGKNKHTEGIVWSFDDKRMHIGNFIETTQTGDSGYDIIKINGYCLYPIAAYYPLTKEAKLLNLPLLPNPFEKVDVEEEFNRVDDEKIRYSTEEYLEWSAYKIGFFDGYIAAQSKQFSLEDVEQILFDYDNVDWSKREHKQPTIIWLKEKIQSLSTQQLPKEFIPEYEDGCLNYTDNKTCDKPCDNMFCLPKGKLELKTITNLEGKQELVGTYKY